MYFPTQPQPQPHLLSLLLPLSLNPTALTAHSLYPPSPPPPATLIYRLPFKPDDGSLPPTTPLLPHYYCHTTPPIINPAFLTMEPCPCARLILPLIDMVTKEQGRGSM